MRRTTGSTTASKILLLAASSVFVSSLAPADLAAPPKPTTEQRVADLETFVNAANPHYKVQPYGGLDWNDGFFAVIEKLKTLPGLKYLVLTYGSDLYLDPQQHHQGDINLLTLNSSAEITKSLLPLPNFLLGNGQLPPEVFGDYKNADGQIKQYINQPWFPTVLRAGPVMLAGHPFQLSVRFSSYPGFALEFPQSCLVFSNPSGLAPLAICDVTLSSDCPLSDAERQAITDALIKKYKLLGNDELIENLEAGKRDLISAPPHPFLRVELARPTLDYNFWARPDLDKFYSGQLRKKEEDDAKGLPDGLKGL